MNVKELTLPFHNESSSVVKLYLEPLSEFFYVNPGQQVTVVAISAMNTTYEAFTVAPNNDYIIIYAPGSINSFVDIYVISEGVRLIPDGN